jgi:predicted transcriptional regulator YdeE
MKPAEKSLPSMRVTGIANQIEIRNATTESQLLWDNYYQQLDTCELNVDYSLPVGILLHPSPQLTEYAMYMAGLFIQEDKSVQLPFIQKDIPASDYACFDIPDHPQALQYIRRYVNQTWWSKVASAPLPVFELEFFSKLADNLSSKSSWCKPQTLCVPLPNE